MHTYILLDRSGSMTNRWDETISALNSYVEKLPSKTNVTFATFSGEDKIKFDIVANNVSTSKWDKNAAKKLKPDGYTPLLDAVGRMAKMIDDADAARVTFLIMTDGGENTSREFTRDNVRQIIKRYRDREYDVVFIGADFDAFGEAGSIGLSRNTVVNTTSGNYGEALCMMAARSTSYASTGAVVSFSDADRQRAAGK